jgi:hypothetical protein
MVPVKCATVGLLDSTDCSSEDWVQMADVGKWATQTGQMESATSSRVEATAFLGYHSNEAFRYPNRPGLS